TKSDPWKDTGLTGEHFVRADIQLDNFFQSYVSIQFNEEGGKLFEEITERNVGKPIAIFVGGDLISAPNVNEKISGGSAQITGQFTSEEAQALARDLNTGAIPAPIVLTGEYTIGATLGHEALTKSLWAGLVGLILVMVFMLLYYRLPGLVANGALLIYGVILIFLIKAELHLGIALGISLIIFGFLVSKIVNNKDSGWEKLLSFVLSCFGFFFLTFLLKTGVVITLAGIAGIILSIGMAVDANILIFERLKEELREGKTLGSAIDSGFHRAWSAIRDSNFSTLITCAILFYFGSSIIRGFAFNLAAGILVSMFTAITITRTLLYSFVGKKIAGNLVVFGVKEKQAKAGFKFIKNSKIWFSFSGLMVAVSVIAMFTFGLNLGIDFKGGTLLEFNFEEAVTKETLVNALQEIEDNKEAPTPTAAAEVEESTEDQLVLSANKTGLLDLSGIQITESGENSFIVKTKYLTSETHDQLIAQMKEKLPKFTEPRFTTIGPVIGKTLLHKALVAMIFALIMIIVYVAFAFRKIPKEVNPWRFGASAIAALVHDVVIVTGVFVILGQFLNVEIDALFITAMLTVFGYSVNDTIVVLDRLRENLIHNSSDTLAETADKALNETLARSINTSLSTLLTLVAILLWGSPSIFYFVLALTIGTTIGTYSSIFLATPLLVRWNRKKKHTE
ncbi:MAG: protein translocase subunit SecF, partial [bacterium]|nr:protein translocase subunit SecF [bacterium]